MIQIDIPGFRKVTIRHIVADHNGTLPCEGELLDGVAEGFRRLAERVAIHVVTADTFGLAAARLEGLPCQLTILPTENQAVKKLEYVQSLGAEETVCIGNGRNDRLMLKAAVIGIALLQEEGAAAETLAAADVVCRNIRDALALFENEKRLIATLRS